MHATRTLVHATCTCTSMHTLPRGAAVTRHRRPIGARTLRARCMHLSPSALPAIFTPHRPDALWFTPHRPCSHLLAGGHRRLGRAQRGSDVTRPCAAEAANRTQTERRGWLANGPCQRTAARPAAEPPLPPEHAAAAHPPPAGAGDDATRAPLAQATAAGGLAGACRPTLMCTAYVRVDRRS